MICDLLVLTAGCPEKPCYKMFLPFVGSGCSGFPQRVPARLGVDELSYWYPEAHCFWWIILVQSAKESWWWLQWPFIQWSHACSSSDCYGLDGNSIIFSVSFNSVFSFYLSKFDVKSILLSCIDIVRKHDIILLRHLTPRRLIIRCLTKDKHDLWPSVCTCDTELHAWSSICWLLVKGCLFSPFIILLAFWTSINIQLLSINKDGYFHDDSSTVVSIIVTQGQWIEMNCEVNHATWHDSIKRLVTLTIVIVRPTIWKRKQRKYNNTRTRDIKYTLASIGIYAKW